MQRIELSAPSTIEGLRAVERDPPRPRRGEVLVRVRASSLNFHDYLVATGVLPASAGRVPLSDGAGEVVELGEDAKHFRVGDRVIGTYFTDWNEGRPSASKLARMRGDQVDGFASDYVALPESDFTLAPQGYSHEQAATLPCAALTAWRALVVEAGIRPGDAVLVEGSGGVSIFALQFARLAGARVMALTSSEAKAEHFRRLGADAVINYREQPAWGAAVREWSGGGVQHVVEVIGGDLSQTLQAAAVGGSICLIGALSRQPIQFPALLAIKGNLRVISVTVGSREHQQEMVRAIDVNGPEPVLDRSFPITELRAAFEHQKLQAHFGKVSITL